MQELDCLGDFCPVPIIKLQAQLKRIKQGDPCLLVTDHSCTLTAVRDFCQLHRLGCGIDEVINGVWEITITNTPSG